jgi:hypothetical protein
LVINGIDDKHGQKIVKEARLVVKRYRIDIDKRRKELNADALEYQRRINGEAKRITTQLEPIEAHLENEEKRVDEELERIKREKETFAEMLYQARCAELTELKFLFNGSKFYARYADVDLEVYVLHVKQWADDEFYAFLGKAKVYFDIHEKQLAEQKAKEEEDRKALAAERARLDAIAKEQAEKDAALKAEADRLEALKPKVEIIAPALNFEIPNRVAAAVETIAKATDMPVEKEIRMRVNIQHCIKCGGLDEGRQYAVDEFFKHLKQVIRKESDLDDFADLYCLND